jgi:ATP-binding cassette, subfamily B, bacterial
MAGRPSQSDSTSSRSAETETLPKGKLNRESLREMLALFRFVKPWMGIFIIGQIFLLLSTATALVFPFSVGQIVNAANGDPTTFGSSLNQTTLILIGVLVLQGIFSFMRIYTFAVVSENTVAEIRKSLFTKIISLPIPWFEQRRTGELMSRITADTQLLHDMLSVSLAEFFRQVATLIIGTIALFFISPKLALFGLLIYPPLVVIAVLFGRLIRRLSKNAQDELASNNVIIEESLQNINMVKSYTNEKLETGRYNTGLQKVVKLGIRSATARGGFVSFIFLALLSSIVMVIWYGGSMMVADELTIGNLITFIIYMMFVGGSMGGLGEVYGQILKSLGATERLREILKEDSEQDASISKETKGGKLNGEIEFSNVKFSYPSRPEIEVLKNINIKIRPGEKVAFAGASGAGKSTLTQLLLGFYPVLHGELRVDGKKISDYDLNFLRSNIGIVPQEVMLFGGSIRENIAYGRPGATEEEVREAARKANAMEFIERFPEGLETLVGERGIKLSGGQRQRIAIARAILKDPAILLLDEATSSLDSESEQLVQEALNTLQEGRTTLIIAHRLGTIRSADRIYVLEQGTIVEQGTHDQLTGKEDGVYSHLVKLQMMQ